jgi:hypothetical protein
MDGLRSVLSCWVHRDRMPAFTGQGSWFRLPSGTVGLEDAAVPSVARLTAPPSAWSCMAAALASQGAAAVLTKAEESDLSERRAIERAGFRAVASMEVERVGVRSWLEFRPYSAGGIGAALALQLSR